MPATRRLTQLLSIFPLLLMACTATDSSTPRTDDREQAIGALRRLVGAPLALETGETGDLRVLALPPRVVVPGHATDPATVALDFLATHHDAFQLDAAEASEFVVTRVDHDRAGDLRHVTLQRVHRGIPVFRGAITLHMDARNGVFRALGDEAYHVAAPTNRNVLSATEAAVAAGRALGRRLSPSLASRDGLRSTFMAPGLLDALVVEPRIFQVGPGDSRFAYQAVVSWVDDAQDQQDDLVLIDAEDGALLSRTSLVETFTGRVFTHSPGAVPSDTRTVVSFDGNPAASPLGWIDSTRKTRGNNAVACTDLNANNVCGANETQPTADANNSFDFPYSPSQNASAFKAAACANAFFLVNDYHDRTYLLGFTEAAGNFQQDNFGRGGLGNDPVIVDCQDGSGTNNANFATPPDGMSPRMQMFLFTINGGAQEDGDFDPTVVYHENTHGLSNRLVGGGSTMCLGGIQSGGMGEGWSDFIGASFLNDPVIGAYVTGNATVGIREFSMATSPLTYAQIKDGTHTEVHAAGEVWAATLWTVRNAIGALNTEQLVVSGMKLTPCNPTMLQARDGIIAADANLNAGANRCALFTAFASRQMGFGASSPNANSTSAIILSTALPPDCGPIDPPRPRDFTSSDVPKAIPDNSPVGISSVINVPAGLDGTLRVTVDVNLTHTFRGDLVIQVVGPAGTFVLSNRAGGSADNFVVSGIDISSAFPPSSSPSGQWRLFVQDLAAADVGRINSFVLHIAPNN